MIEELPPHRDTRDPEPFAGPDHPMRRLTRSLAFGGGWGRDEVRRVTEVFDGLAAEWSEDGVDPRKEIPLLDAIERGRAPLDARWLELGSGTGAATRVLHGRAREQIAADLSWQMLVHAPQRLAPRVLADSARLPFRDDAADVVLLINMLLFPGEVDRVLRPGGAVVWINTLGDQTPIHLPADDVARALPGEWTGVTARAGHGFWAVLHRGRRARLA